MQQSDRSFFDESNNLGFDDMLSGTTLISLDYDRDGDLDMVQSIKEFDGEAIPFRLLENRILESEVGNYLVVKPRMLGSNHFALGAVVTAYTNTLTHKRIIHAGTSFYGQEPAEAFFGLGQSSVVDSLKVTWPGGETSTWYDISVDQIIEVDDEDAVHRPTGLSAVQAGQEIHLNWNDISTNESHYTLQRSTSDIFSTFVEETLPENSTSYFDADVSDGPRYYYRLSAKNASRSSRFTDAVRVDYEPALSVEKSSEVAYYPNPSSGTIRINSHVPIKNLEIYGIDGAQQTISKWSKISNKEIQVDVSNLGPGVYLLKIDAVTKRLVIK
jgi:hypothetical protein